MEFELLFMPQVVTAANLDYNSENLVKDLRLDILFDAMSGGNPVIHSACSAIMSRPLIDKDPILNRSAVVHDAVAHPNPFVELFTISCEAVESVRTYIEFTSPKYDRVIPNKKKIAMEAEIAQLNLKHLHRLKNTLTKYCTKFSSEAMLGLCHTVDKLFENDHIAHIEATVDQLGALKSTGRFSISGRIGEGLKQADVLLNEICEPVARGKRRPAVDGVEIQLSSMALIQNAEELIESMLVPVHKAIAGYNRSMQRFFEKLRLQIGFFVGCVNLLRKLKALGVPICHPQITLDSGEFAGKSLIDISLALKERNLPTVNGFCFTGKRQVVITGPNQGGKTTFLRSIGLAQVMMQCGMFVAATEYVSSLFSGLYTHFPSAEDDKIQRGLLEVELNKLSAVISKLKPGGLLLMNESFQTTMPLDAKRLAAEIVSALAEAGVTVLFVTHLYEFAIDLYRQHRRDALLLRAQRGGDGKNTYEIKEGEPYKSVFGLDLFRELI
jgi:hypothetical protein